MFTCISRQKKHNSWCRKCPHTFTWTQRAGIKSVHLWLGVVWSVRRWDKTWGSWFICTCLTGHIQIFLALHLPFQQNRSTFRLWPTLTQPRSSFKLKLSYAEGATKKIVILSLKVSGNARYQIPEKVEDFQSNADVGLKANSHKANFGYGVNKNSYFNTYTCIVYSLPKAFSHKSFCYIMKIFFNKWVKI